MPQTSFLLKKVTEAFICNCAITGVTCHIYIVHSYQKRLFSHKRFGGVNLVIGHENFEAKNLDLCAKVKAFAMWIILAVVVNIIVVLSVIKNAEQYGIAIKY